METTTTFLPKPVQKQCQAHLVPCKIRYTGPTDELEEQFIMDKEVTSALHENRNVTYIRGRKVIGEQVMFEDRTSYILSTREDDNGNLIIEPTYKVTEIFNYEREGNEERLTYEMSKFKECRELDFLIHEG
ncbi:hypothetical protein KDRO_C07180 [Kluyveromyces lactis]|nr:hypothetical protein KDRO_C07180 [Kluyveromyces lactis]